LFEFGQVGILPLKASVTYLPFYKNESNRVVTENKKSLMMGQGF
jgi:hypothetical protein